MNREDFQPRGGAGLQIDSAPLSRSLRRRLVAGAMFLVLLCGSAGAGVLADLSLRWLGLGWPPVFTPLWGTGALILVGVGWTRFELRAAAARAAQRRQSR
jgi:hypothetical protein